MSILDKLEKIVHIHDLINIVIVKNDQNKDKLKVSRDGKVEINTSALEDADKPDLYKFLRKLFDEKGATFIERKAKERVEDIKQSLELRTTREIFEFYSDKIKQHNLDALEASLYLREVFKRGESVELLKMDIIHDYGHDGKNICNLCSSGYFEGYIKELYLEMSRQPDFVINHFHGIFKRIIRDSPFTVFVNQRKSKNDIKNEIENKLTKFKNYGINYLAVHGLGVDNVKKILEAIKELEEEREEIATDMKKERTIIEVKIRLKQEKIHSV